VRRVSLGLDLPQEGVLKRNWMSWMSPSEAKLAGVYARMTAAA
jgi:hypothetical protein